MNAERYTVVEGRKIEEFYWNGRYVVYIDNKLFSGNFHEAINSVKTK